MKQFVLSLLFLLAVFSTQNIVLADTILDINQGINKDTKIFNDAVTYITPDKADNNYAFDEKPRYLFCKNIKNCLSNMELKTTKLSKGRTFIVRSNQSLSNSDLKGKEVIFESMQNEYLLNTKNSSKVLFHGTIEKTESPRKIGRSGTVKIALDKITIDKITYPVSAFISKIDNKDVYANTLKGSPIYLTNLSTNANNGNIPSSYKDPCQSHICEGTNAVTKPLVYLGSAALMGIDLLLSPFTAMMLRGNDLTIPQNTYFEITLDKDLYVLNI